jgi:hypothetical protein
MPTFGNPGLHEEITKPCKALTLSGELISLKAQCWSNQEICKGRALGFQLISLHNVNREPQQFIEMFGEKVLLLVIKR